MALVKCHDCGRDVSTSAPSCPQCGRPIAASESKIVQTQRTGGKYEAIGLGMIVIGMGLVLAGMIPAGGLLFVGGFLVFLIGRLMQLGNPEPFITICMG